jgi:hypothetical protein
MSKYNQHSNISKQIVPILPLSWEFLQEYKDNPLKFTGDLRNPVNTINHDKLLDKSSLNSRTEYMLNFLGFSNSSNPNIMKIIINKFPYDLEKGIFHHVLFINPELEKDYVNNDLIESFIAIKTKEFGYNEYIYFEQPYERRSLPTITHYHVFFRK